MASTNVKEFVSEKAKSLDREQMAYLISFIFLLLILPLSKVTDFPVYWFSFGACISGLVFYLIGATEKLTSNVFGKTIASIAVIGCTTFNLAMAHSFVNFALEAPVSPFGYTVTISAILSIPYTASLFLAFGFVFWLMVILVTSIIPLYQLPLHKLFVFSKIKKLLNDNPLVLIGRLFSATVLFSIAIGFLKDNQGYMDATSGFTRWFAYNLEMEKFSYCDVDENQKVAYLGSNKIVVGQEQGDTYKFKVRDCEIDS
ncbi:hypothetical protein ACOV11_11755 [Vibrio natriegens]|uniref:hypothetical protein n=1 Tax=Vibrio TaxID=662 RepID=UPI0022869B45|nr:hypothetical protein [Vibrio diabolicus]MCZ0741819.1 hypothetical protein [Vibrio diabolicus]MEE3878629.1 hypothetical protein [Vibrio sp. YYF0003]